MSFEEQRDKQRAAFKENYKRYNKRFGIPCLVHSTKINLFKKILKTQKLLRPSDCPAKKTRPGMFEEMINIHDCVFIALGFLYNSEEDDSEDDFGFIYSLDEVDESFEVFHFAINSQINKIVIRYWRDNDPEYLKTFMLQGSQVREIIQYFLDTDKKGWGSLKHWVIEDRIHSFYKKYERDKPEAFEEINKLIFKEREKNQVKHFIKRYLKNEYKESKIEKTEIVIHRNLELDNKNLLGFFVRDGHWRPDIKAPIIKFLKESKNIDVDNFWIFNGSKKVLAKELFSLSIWH
ncbi:hypothetical protein ACFL6I_09240 [candidate division KSB1 bacterium]